jgi:hypothetical protein
VTVLDSSPAPTAVPGKRRWWVQHTYCKWPPCPDRERPVCIVRLNAAGSYAEPGVRPALMHKRARGWRDRAKRPNLTVMAHTADHLPRHVGACSFRIRGPSGNAAIRMTRLFRYSGTYRQMRNDEESGP